MSSLKYYKGTILVFDPVPHGGIDEVIFIVIDKLYLYDGNKLIIVGIKFTTLDYNNHLVAYEVIRPDIDDWMNVAVFFDSLPIQVPHTLHAHSDNKLYITLLSPLWVIIEILPY